MFWNFSHKLNLYFGLNVFYCFIISIYLTGLVPFHTLCFLLFIADEIVTYFREEDNSKTHTIVFWRVKEMRLATIKNQIMKTLWPVGPPPSLSGNMTLHSPSARQNLLRVIAEKMKSHNTFVPEDVYTEKIQSFYPSCKLPKHNFPTNWYNLYLGYLFNAGLL